MRSPKSPSGEPRDILSFAAPAAQIENQEISVRVGVFTALLAQMSLDDVLKKLKSLNIDTVELGTGNYPGDPHCKLSMLQNKTELKEFKQKLADNGFSISALSCHGNPLHPVPQTSKAYQE